MSGITDICNRALAEIGTRSTITGLDEPSNEAINCALWYDKLRKSLLRAAHWGFARTQKTLGLLATLDSGNLPFPFLYQYAYPSDALAIRYVTKLPPGYIASEPIDPGAFPILMPDRSFRFLVSKSGPNKVIVTNLHQAIGVYTEDVTNPAVFDTMYEDALTAALASKLVMALTGNVQMKQEFMLQAQALLETARAADANEAVPETDHVPDWIAIRGFGNLWRNIMCPDWGMWYAPSIPWAD